MLMLPGNAQFYLCQQAVDLRRSFEGLSVVIAALFPVEITSGAFFIFLNRSKDRMKVLYWDGDGLAIWYKRLEQGSFSQKILKDQKVLDRREFLIKQLFGQKADKYVSTQSEQQLCFEGFDKIVPVEEKKQQISGHERQPRKSTGADTIKFPADLPIEQTIIDLSEGDKIYPETGLPVW